MRTVDPAVENEINSISPRNPYGNPVYRCVWSADVLHWAAGWWNVWDQNTGALIRRVWEARKVPKYQQAARWMIEKWMPPEFFGSRENWAAATEILSVQNGWLPELGPYPAEGDYVSIWTCADAEGKFMQVTPTLAKYAVELNMLPLPSAEQMKSEAARRKEHEDDQFVKYIDNIMGDPFPFLGRTSNVRPTSVMTKILDQKKRGKALA